MAVATETLGRRRNREAADAAARQRRSRMMLIGLSVLLAIVAVVEVPATLSKLNSKSSVAPEASTAVSQTAVAPGGVTAATIKAARAKLALIDRRFPEKDPFVAQLGQSSATVSIGQPFATPPAVRSSNFVAKDPFKVQLGVEAGQAVPAVPIATGPAVSAPASGLTSTGSTTGGSKTAGSTSAAPTSGFIVVLRSLDSKAAGLQELKLAHSHGFPSAQLLFSSKYSTLRHGYWVVYSRYSTAARANAGVAQARAHGYLSAYRRVAKP
jgi:hypothetical protein